MRKGPILRRSAPARAGDHSASDRSAPSTASANAAHRDLSDRPGRSDSARVPAPQLQRYQSMANASHQVAQLQRYKSMAEDRIRDIAAHGMQGRPSTLPHLSRIQRAFGRHDVTGIRSYSDSRAQAANAHLDSLAYASRNGVAFAHPPTLHTAAHEAAHIVQQRTGVRLSGGIDRPGDRYERHADAVADAVVQGRSAEALLSAPPTGGSFRRSGSPGISNASPSPNVQRLPDPRSKRVKKKEVDEADLFFGHSAPRGMTLDRLHLVRQAKNPRTIDDYNDALGISQIVGDRRERGVIIVREGLRAVADVADNDDADIVRAWEDAVTVDVPDNPRIELWLRLLAERVENIGLFDLGGQAGADQQQANDRQPWLGYTISAELVQEANKNRYKFTNQEALEMVSYWLRQDNTSANNLTYPRGFDIQKFISWLAQAFFRRSSKLGLDFALNKLNSKVFFNLATDHGFQVEAEDGQTEERAVTTPRYGLLEALDVFDTLAFETITMSELKHIDRLIADNPDVAEQLILYGESHRPRKISTRTKIIKFLRDLPRRIRIATGRARTLDTMRIIDVQRDVNPAGP